MSPNLPPNQRKLTSVQIFINCIYLSAANIPKFVTKDFLQEGKRQLSVVCDVSCTHSLSPTKNPPQLANDIPPGDTTNPNNPIPFCDKPTYFNSPTISLPEFVDPPLSYITIDHLPSLLPREASQAFSTALLPSLLELKDRANAPVWKKAQDLFDRKVKEMDEARNHVNGSTVPTARP